MIGDRKPIFESQFHKPYVSFPLQQLHRIELHCPQQEAPRPLLVFEMLDPQVASNDPTMLIRRSSKWGCNGSPELNGRGGVEAPVTGEWLKTGGVGAVGLAGGEEGAQQAWSSHREERGRSQAAMGVAGQNEGRPEMSGTGGGKNGGQSRGQAGRSSPGAQGGLRADRAGLARWRRPCSGRWWLRSAVIAGKEG
ncbi:hypothetical protein J5N97_026052 [Dioscorea zingiberensis]|uniref:Uncharacterized protein n=1 Tax=Dioscorea zingiberensis TaxID=325984 RepID=A0A9D5C2P7_9LILI|nr:hypothetical protein J5N97_026052 [Dioscorea zingiberensis]